MGLVSHLEVERTPRVLGGSTLCHAHMAPYGQTHLHTPFLRRQAMAARSLIRFGQHDADHRLRSASGRRWAPPPHRSLIAVQHGDSPNDSPRHSWRSARVGQPGFPLLGCRGRFVHTHARSWSLLYRTVQRHLLTSTRNRPHVGIRRAQGRRWDSGVSEASGGSGAVLPHAAERPHSEVLRSAAVSPRPFSVLILGGHQRHGMLHKDAPQVEKMHPTTTDPPSASAFYPGCPIPVPTTPHIQASRASRLRSSFARYMCHCCSGLSSARFAHQITRSSCLRCSLLVSHFPWRME